MKPQSRQNLGAYCLSKHSQLHELKKQEFGRGFVKLFY